MLWERKRTKKLNIYQLLITHNPKVSIFEHCLISRVNHEEQQKLASTGCLWCIKQWTDLPNIGNTKSKELWSQEVNQSINTWSAPKYSQESQNEIWHHTKGTSPKTVEI